MKLRTLLLDAVPTLLRRAAVAAVLANAIVYEAAVVKVEGRMQWQWHHRPLRLNILGTCRETGASPLIRSSSFLPSQRSDMG